MVSRNIIWSCLCLFLAVLALTLGTVFSQAQNGKKMYEQIGDASGENGYPNLKAKLQAILNGTANAPPKAEWKEISEASALWLVGRFTHTTVVEKYAVRHPDGIKAMEKAFTEFKYIPEQAAHVNNIPKNQEFMKIFGKELVKRFRQLFDQFDMKDNHRITVVNAALMLPELAKTKNEAAADFLLELIQDPKQHEVVKLYALKGLKEFFPARTFTEGEEGVDKKLLERKVRESKQVETLLTFLDHKWPMDMDAKAVTFIRREAIANLAQAQVPTVFLVVKKKKIEGPVVYGLVKTLTPNGLNPPSSLAEKIEAAVGLCNLKTAATSEEYQPEVAIYLVAHFFLEFTAEYQKDWANFSRKDKKIPPLVPWKYNAERFIQGLDNLSQNSKANHPASFKAALKLQQSIKRVLDQMKIYANIQDETAAYQPVVPTLRPQNIALFKSIPGPKLEMPN